MRRFLTMRRFLWILPSAWLATLLFAAAWVEAHPHGAEPIIIGIAPQQEPGKVYAMWQPFLRYLEREVGHAFALETAPPMEEFQKRVLDGGSTPGGVTQARDVRPGNRLGAWPRPGVPT